MDLDTMVPHLYTSMHVTSTQANTPKTAGQSSQSVTPVPPSDNSITTSITTSTGLRATGRSHVYSSQCMQARWARP